MVARKKSQSKIKTNDLQEIKANLLSDLDQFLVEENIEKKQRLEEKQKALIELDRLIRQDLSYGSILSTIKKDSQKNIQQNQTSSKITLLPFKNVAEKEENNDFLPLHSAHIIDLRNKQNLSKKSSFDWTKGYNNFKETINSNLKKQATRLEKPSKQIKFSSPKKVASANFFDQKNKFFSSLTTLNWQPAFSRGLTFALIVFMLLAPLRGLVFLNRLQEDKLRLFDFGKQGFVNFQSGAIFASEDAYEMAQADFEKALINFKEAQEVLNEYRQWMLSVASYVPVVGKPFSLSKDLLEVASNISQAAGILNEKFQSENNPTEYIYLINQQIQETIPYLEKANNKLQKSSVAFLPEDLKPFFDDLKIYLPLTLENFYTLEDIFSTLLGVLGHENEKRYLILFQNNNELRATGGFIGSIALFDIYQGKVNKLEIPRGGTYDLAYGQKVKLKAPDALSLINHSFNIWDANWWYDFPTSAKKIIWFYQSGGGSSLDGVIAINADLLGELLKLIGPLKLDFNDYELEINADNFSAVLQEEVELHYDKELNEPKGVIADLAPLVLQKLLETDNYRDLVNIFALSLSNKDIQLYLTDENLQKKINNYGWSGVAENNNRDYLAVINTNIAGGKTDKDIIQRIDHQVEFRPDGEIINTVRITRTNQGPAENIFAGIDGGNVSYLRIYTPLGSQFIEARGFDKMPSNYFRGEAADARYDVDVLREENKKIIDSSSGMEIYDSLDKTVFAHWMLLKPGESKTAIVKYKLPFKFNFNNPLVNNWWEKLIKKNLNLNNYSLLAQSQSGQKNTVFHSSILLPKNSRVVFKNATNIKNLKVVDLLVAYDNELNKDQYFGFILAN